MAGFSPARRRHYITNHLHPQRMHAYVELGCVASESIKTVKAPLSAMHESMQGIDRPATFVGWKAKVVKRSDRREISGQPEARAEPMAAGEKSGARQMRGKAGDRKRWKLKSMHVGLFHHCTTASARWWWAASLLDEVRYQNCRS